MSVLFCDRCGLITADARACRCRANPTRTVRLDLPIPRRDARKSEAPRGGDVLVVSRASVDLRARIDGIWAQGASDPDRSERFTEHRWRPWRSSPAPTALRHPPCRSVNGPPASPRRRAVPYPRQRLALSISTRTPECTAAVAKRGLLTSEDRSPRRGRKSSPQRRGPAL